MATMVLFLSQIAILAASISFEKLSQKNTYIRSTMHQRRGGDDQVR
jgi:hypothetical protein